VLILFNAVNEVVQCMSLGLCGTLENHSATQINADAHGVVFDISQCEVMPLPG
jgi:hypothetical protein